MSAIEMRISEFSSRQALARARGFSLIELMIAITLGILLSIGLVTLFGATSKTNRLQEAMAEMQENGRFAMTRLNSDLRLTSRQIMNTGGYAATTAGPNGTLSLAIAPQVYVTSIPFPDGAVIKPTGWAGPTAWWPLSPRYFVQGYDCTATCSPTVPAPPFLPIVQAVAAAGNRVTNADVLTVRYLNADGWSYYRGEIATPACTGGGLGTITVTPATVPTTAPGMALNFANNDLAMLVTNSNAEIFQVTVSGNVLTPVGTVGCIQAQTGSGGPEVTLFNFSRNFITETYWLQLVADANNPGRFIPTLMRSQADNSGAAPVASEIVQGVEQMNFLYGMQKTDGTVTYIKAGDVATQSTAANCPPPPSQYFPPNLPADTVEPECLWRSVKNIEAHILVDSINNMFDLTAPDMIYTYSGDLTGFDATGALPSNQKGAAIPFGKMMRREFVSLVSVRNYNP